MSEPNIEWHPVAKASELEEEEPEFVKIGDEMVCVVRLEDGIYAINDICSHEFAHLSEGFVEDGQIECPLHQARFDVKTGECLEAPAEDDVASYKVKVEGDQVYVGLPKS